MKKLFITFLILGVAGGAFAQFTKQLTVDVNPNAMVATTPLGDAADAEHVLYDQPGGGSGTLNILTPYKGWMGQENQLRLAFEYRAPSYGARIRFNFDRFIRPEGPGSGNNVFFRTDNPPNLADFLDTSSTARDIRIDEYRVWGTVGRFTAEVTNMANRGRVAAFNLEDFGIRPVKIDNYGVHTPQGATVGADGNINTLGSFLLFREGDNNNFLRSNRINGEYNRFDVPYFMLTANFDPFTVQLAGDPGNNAFTNDSNGPVLGFPGSINPNSTIRANGGIRVSGNRIANIVSFDAMYKFRGGDPDSDDVAGVQPDGKGVATHNFGVYANLFLLDTLGIGVGYTGLVRAYENYDVGYTSHEQAGPYFNGIDIRLQFTGIDRLRLTMHNNVSWSVVNGADPNDKRVYGVLGEGGLGLVGLNQQETWFALYNAIGASFRMTDALTLNADIGNRLGIYNRNFDGGDYERLRDLFAAALWAGYSVNSNVLLQGGFRFMVENQTEKDGRYPDLNDASWGLFTFAIPLRVRIVY